MQIFIKFFCKDDSGILKMAANTIQPERQNRLIVFRVHVCVENHNGGANVKRLYWCECAQKSDADRIAAILGLVSVEQTGTLSANYCSPFLIIAIEN